MTRGAPMPDHPARRDAVDVGDVGDVGGALQGSALRASTAPGPARRVWRLRAALLLVWASVSFGSAWFARELDFTVGAWPLHEWMAAQGAVLVFIAIVAVYAWVMRRVDEESAPRDEEGAAVNRPEASRDA